MRRLSPALSVVRHACRWRGRRADDPEAAAAVKRYVSWDAGPRASQYLILGAKARAAMDVRPYPDLADVNAVALPVMRHRIVMNFQGEADGVKVEDLIGQGSATPK